MTRYKYRQVADTIRGRIDAGDYPPGSTLPGRVELAANFGCSVVTIRAALAILSDEGRIQCRWGAAALVRTPMTRADRFDTIRRLLADLARQLDEVQADWNRDTPG